jgi:phosphohistidine phosphatase
VQRQVDLNPFLSASEQPMILYLVRHAWAGERDENLYPNDDLRPLTPDGKKRFAKMLDRLADAKIRPTWIATSPLVRCRQTADLLAKHLPDRPEMTELVALKPDSDLGEILAWTGRHQDEEIAWVGHAPDVSDLAAALIGDGSASIRFAKGAIAAIRFERTVERNAGQLVWLATAGLLGC